MASAESLEAVFRSHDAIMRPDIKELLFRYKSLGGDLYKAATNLIVGYKGSPNLIDVLLPILISLSENPEAEIVRQIRATWRSLFHADDDMDKILLKHKEPPRWVHIMLRSPDIWTETVISLAREHPGSLFLAYCVNRLAQVRPDSVKKLPSCLVTYRAYSSVVQNCLGRLRSEKSVIDDLIGVITTDDLTITHTAFVCHQMADPELTRMITERMSGKPYSLLFEQVMLRLDGCEASIMKVLTGEQPLTAEMIDEFERKSDGSSFLRYLIVHRIKRGLFVSQTHEDIVERAVKCLALISRERLREDDVQFMIEAVKVLNRPIRLREKGQLSKVMRALQVRFFVDACLPKLLRLIESESLSPLEGEGTSPEAWMLCEVSYHHQGLCGKIADKIFEYLPKCSKPSEHYAVLRYLATIGWAVCILDKLKEMLDVTGREDIQKTERRQFCCFLLENAGPPYTAAFVDAMAKCLNHQAIRPLLIPPGRFGVLDVHKRAMRLIKIFVDNVEKEPRTDELSEGTRALLRSLKQDAAGFD
jgi:hypothetical protein